MDDPHTALRKTILDLYLQLDWLLFYMGIKFPNVEIHIRSLMYMKGFRIDDKIRGYGMEIHINRYNNILEAIHIFRNGEIFLKTVWRYVESSDLCLDLDYIIAANDILTDILQQTEFEKLEEVAK